MAGKGPDRRYLGMVLEPLGSNTMCLATALASQIIQIANANYANVST